MYHSLIIPKDRTKRGSFERKKSVFNSDQNPLLLSLEDAFRLEICI